MSDQGVVQKCEANRNGNMSAQIGGKYYYFDRAVGDNYPKAGARIEFQWKTGGREGNLKIIEKWRPLQDASGAPETGSTVTDVDYLRSVSNIVGSACAAGKVATPEELEKWCMGARMGLLRAMSKAKYETAQQEPENQFADPYEGYAQATGDDPGW